MANTWLQNNSPRPCPINACVVNYGPCCDGAQFRKVPQRLTLHFLLQLLTDSSASVAAISVRDNLI